MSKYVPEIKEKQKKNVNIDCLRGKMLLDVFHMGLKKTWFTKYVTFLELGVDRPNTTHKLVIMWNVALEFVLTTGFPSFRSHRCVWT